MAISSGYIPAWEQGYLDQLYLEIAAQIGDENIADNSITDSKISPLADIDPAKILNTALTQVTNFAGSVTGTYSNMVLNVPAAQVYKTSVQAVAGAWADVTWNTAEFIDSQFSFSSNAITVNDDGRYQIGYFINTQGTSLEYEIQCRVTVNGSPLSRSEAYSEASEASRETAGKVFMAELSASDSVKIQSRITGAANILTDSLFWMRGF